MISIKKNSTEDYKILYEVIENGETLASCEGEFTANSLIITDIFTDVNDGDYIDGAIRAMLNNALQAGYNSADFSALSQEKLQIVIDLGIVDIAPVIFNIEEFFSKKKCISE